MLAVTNGRLEIRADAPVEKGGGGAGLGAHELLEAALAACLNMAVRMHADQHAIPLGSVTTSVSLRRPDPQTVCFDYSLELDGPLTADQRNVLHRVAGTCPVRQTLSKNLQFHARAPANE